jgi:hypothetical protein
VKGPKLVHRHRFEIMRFHFRFHFFNPDDLSLSKAASAQGPILGDSGPLQWSKKAKTECPNPNSHSYLTASVHQKLGLVAGIPQGEHPNCPSRNRAPGMAGCGRSDAPGRGSQRPDHDGAHRRHEGLESSCRARVQPRLQRHALGKAEAEAGRMKNPPA